MRVARVVDLSVPLDAATPVFPGDPPVLTRPALTRASDGVEVLHVQMGSQSGTHVDAPRHVLAGGAAVDEVPVERFLCPAVVADVRGLPARSAIGRERLEPWWRRLGPGVALVLHTGWSAHWGTARYWEHPWLSPPAAAAVLGTGTRLVAVDAPSVDPTLLDGAPALPATLPVHQAVAAVGGVIVENLTGLDRVDFGDPLLSVLPLRLTGADGAPCRAVALQLGT